MEYKSNNVDARPKEIIEEICKELRLNVIEMEIMPDHAHPLMEVDATALQSSLRDLDIAYQNFFRRAKKGENRGIHASRASVTIGPATKASVWGQTSWRWSALSTTEIATPRRTS